MHAYIHFGPKANTHGEGFAEAQEAFAVAANVGEAWSHRQHGLGTAYLEISAFSKLMMCLTFSAPSLSDLDQSAEAYFA